jgi:N-acetylmuramic acid 6-phosphate etherase
MIDAENRSGAAPVGLDTLSVPQLLTLMNEADAEAPKAVARALPELTRAVDAVARQLRAGGRLIYIGSGTSGRLGALDAAECPPTFGIEPEQVQAYIAGGDVALRLGVEGAEDDAEAGAAVADKLAVGPHDAFVGIAASATTPYTVAALRRARERGAVAIAIGCAATGPLYEAADIAVVLAVGPEVLSGSTRLKAGTAQKLALNMLSTATMTQLGHVYGDMMVDVRITNAKLRRRAIGIVRRIAGVDESSATEALRAAGDDVKTAVVMLRRGVTVEAARDLLRAADGQLRRVIG